MPYDIFQVELLRLLDRSSLEGVYKCGRSTGKTVGCDAKVWETLVVQAVLS